MTWDELERRAEDVARLSPTFLLLMGIAGVIATAAILTDNVILLIGAMIVAPDFGPSAGLSIGVVTRRWSRAGQSLAALCLGYLVAAAAGFVAAWIANALGNVPTGPTQLVLLIEEVNFVVFVVAVGSGLAGAISLGTAKSGAVVGVAVSITTVPAATAVGLALALGQPDDALRSLALLLVNLFGLLAAQILAFTVAKHLPWLRRTQA